MLKQILELPISKLAFHTGFVIVILGLLGLMGWFVYVAFTLNPVVGFLLGIFTFGVVLLAAGILTGG